MPKETAKGLPQMIAGGNSEFSKGINRIMVGCIVRVFQPPLTSYMLSWPTPSPSLIGYSLHVFFLIYFFTTFNMQGKFPL